MEFKMWSYGSMGFQTRCRRRKSEKGENPVRTGSKNTCESAKDGACVLH